MWGEEDGGGVGDCRRTMIRGPLQVRSKGTGRHNNWLYVRSKPLFYIYVAHKTDDKYTVFLNLVFLLMWRGSM